MLFFFVIFSVFIMPLFNYSFNITLMKEKKLTINGKLLLAGLAVFQLLPSLLASLIPLVPFFPFPSFPFIATFHSWSSFFRNMYIPHTHMFNAPKHVSCNLILFDARCRNECPKLQQWDPNQSRVYSKMHHIVNMPPQNKNKPVRFVQ